MESAEAIISHGGASLLILFESSPCKLVSSVFSEFNWKIYKFAVVPKGWWDDKNNVREFLEDVFKEVCRECHD